MGVGRGGGGRERGWVVEEVGCAGNRRRGGGKGLAGAWEIARGNVMCDDAIGHGVGKCIFVCNYYAMNCC